MIKDKDGNVRTTLTITTALRDEAISTIKNRIILNLKAIKQLLKVEGYEDVGGALYTYALEEYGKILFPKSCCPVLPDNNEITFRYKSYKCGEDSKQRCGFLAHDDKFSRMVKHKNFQDSCKVLNKGDYEPNDVVLTDYEAGLIADLQARMSLLFADFNEDQKSIMGPPSVDREMLERNVDCLLDFMETQVFF